MNPEILDMGSSGSEDSSAKRRVFVIEWLNNLFPGLDIPLEASEEELRVQLFDGRILCSIVNQLDPNSQANQRSSYVSSGKPWENVRRFLSAVDGMGLPKFTPDDLEHGPFSSVVDCLLSLRDRLNFDYSEGDVQVTANSMKGGNFQLSEVEKKSIFLEPRSDQVLHCPDLSEQSIASFNHVEHKFQEVFQLKHGHYSDAPAAKILENLRLNGLDNVPTHSLLNFINRVFDESIERKNGEIPLRAASLLRKVMQEIERRISMQAGHINNQNNFIKAREEKYQSRIRVLETLSSGTIEETQIMSNQLQLIKAQMAKVKESMKQEEQNVWKLMKEKENSSQMVLELKQDLETTKSTYEHKCQQLIIEANQNEARFQERIKEVEFYLSASTKRINELEAFSESKFRSWNKKKNVLNNFISFQLQSVKSLRMLSDSAKLEFMYSQRKWKEEMNIMEIKLKALGDAAENYHTVLAENRKLYNEVQELKGNIRVYCRIRPFLPDQNSKSTTINYVGENGELVLVNPSRQGKDGHRMFKFNKVLGPTATQVKVFLDIQPLIRSVLDGYNVCIFAYGQTGSGKTYTMSGPNLSSKEDWGVNYRALNDLFHISQVRRNAFVYEVGVQMVEIYNEQVRDLLSNDGSQKRLGIWSTSLPQGLAVPDASMFMVKSTSDVLELMQFGQTNRAVGSTALNERSSRSHSILTVHVRGIDLKSGSTSRGCLHLIDLAGSERVDRSKVTGDRLKEAQYINKSLSSLGDVIFALSQKSAHVPYRNSKLTQVLQTSLGGQAKTLMFVQVNPDVESYSETLSTLMFAERVSGVELGAAKSSKEGKDVKDLIEQVASLKCTIVRKDEEIEQLQQLKDLSSGSTKGYSLRKISSSPGVSSFGGMTEEDSGKILSFGDKDVPNPNILSVFNDKNSDADSQLSMLNGRKTTENCLTDYDIDGSFDEEWDGILSDDFGGDLFFEEAESSIYSSLDSAILSEAGKPSTTITEKIPKPPPRMPKLISQRTSLDLSSRAKSIDSLKSLGPKKVLLSQVSQSSVKPPKR